VDAKRDRRNNHDYVDTIKDKDETHEAANLAKSVYYAEKAAINKRREFIKEQIGRDRRESRWTGLAFSGGGIRSASFGLGVLQALQAKHDHHPNVYGAPRKIRPSNRRANQIQNS
jgi:hypothetical protein